MKIEVAASKFTNALRVFADKMQIGIGQTVKDQSRLLAERLRSMTYPSNQKQGQNRVEADIHKVYQRNEWFESKFSFRNEKLKDRVLQAVRSQDSQTLQAIFQRSRSLSRLQIEEFSTGRHERGRDSRGRVRYKQPLSYPVRGQQEAAAYIKRRQQSVGSVKGGWGRCVALLGGKTPGWLNRSSGHVTDRSGDQNKPFVLLTNTAPTAFALMQRTGVIQRALAGRARSMAKAAEKQLEAAMKAAAL